LSTLSDRVIRLPVKYEDSEILEAPMYKPRIGFSRNVARKLRCSQLLLIAREELSMGCYGATEEWMSAGMWE